jgi:hypothetical protein
MTIRQDNPRPSLHASAMTDHTGQLVLIAMTGPGTPYHAEKDVWWWYKLPGQSEWTLIEHANVITPIDQRRAFVRLAPLNLKLATAIKQVHLGCSDDREVPPSGEVAIWTAAGETRSPDLRESRPPSVPIAIEGNATTLIEPRPRVEVSMSRTRVPNTPDEILWVVIRNSANSLGFDQYQEFMDDLFLHKKPVMASVVDRRQLPEISELSALDRFLYSQVDAYRVLKVATEFFVKTHCGVVPDPQGPLRPDPAAEEARFGHLLPREFQKLWQEDYLVRVGPKDAPRALILPYLDLIRRKLGDLGTVRGSQGMIDHQAGLLQDKLVHPVLLELIWSYWMEEGMLVQGFNSIVRRFQNVRAPGERDPLAQLEIDSLRPLNHLMWGWVQDEINQLSVLRRAHEYDHQYGFTLHGKAVAELRTADRRSKFLEAFHNLLWRCIQFYRQDDDTTVIADGFTVLNALKETHYLLAQGAHNQFGDLPATARQEMLVQQWLLSRPEMREFLGGRVAVPYAEPWMDRVDALKTLKGWTPTSVVHFRDLAVFGEQVLLSVRWGAWSTITDPASAANWARYWRSEIQGYVHAYRAATSVDLTAEITDQRQADQRFLPPSVHLRRMLAHGAR